MRRSIAAQAEVMNLSMKSRVFAEVSAVSAFWVRAVNIATAASPENRFAPKERLCAMSGLVEFIATIMKQQAM